MWTLRPAVATDAPALSELAMDSKASWGYSADFMEACREELTITDRRIDDEMMTVAESEDGVVVGFVSVTIDGASADLADLFVAPQAQSAGVGRALWESACRDAIDAGCRLMTVEADPNAVDWYVGFLKKVFTTKEFQGYLQKGALKAAFATGSEYVKWVEENDKLHKQLMEKGGLIKK